MIYSIFATKDTTLYEQYDSMNTGIDEVLTIEKIVSSSLTPNLYNSRILLKFANDITGSLPYGGSVEKAYLKLYTTEAKTIPHDYTLEAFAVRGDWSMGQGRETNTPRTTDGASWKYNDGLNTWTSAGSDWHTTKTATQTFTYEDTDINLDVTNIVNDWTGSVVANDGFIIKRSGSQETDANRYGVIQFFSENTHTVYPPRLEICWDDKVWATGSLSALDMTNPDEVFFYIKGNRGEYVRGSKVKFLIRGREKYPVKTYGTTSAELGINYIPENSASYAIMDMKTGETIIPHDTTYTNISCDATKGTFIEFYSDSLFEERHYQVQLKYTEQSGQFYYYNIKDTFKVIR